MLNIWVFISTTFDQLGLLLSLIILKNNEKQNINMCRWRCFGKLIKRGKAGYVAFQFKESVVQLKFNICFKIFTKDLVPFQQLHKIKPI